MLGLRRKRRLELIERQYRELFEIAHSRGNSCVASFYEGIRDAAIGAKADHPIVAPSLPTRAGEGIWGTNSAKRAAKWGGARELSYGGHDRNRTGVYGFAVRCVTTPPRGQPGSFLVCITSECPPRHVNTRRYAVLPTMIVT
jgi:hypothetical protein